MARITQKDISNKIRGLFAPDDQETGILPLLRILASKTVMPPPQMGTPEPQAGTPQEGITPISPTMPNIVGRQQLMESNAIAAKYPYLGAR